MPQAGKIPLNTSLRKRNKSIIQHFPWFYDKYCRKAMRNAYREQGIASEYRNKQKSSKPFQLTALVRVMGLEPIRQRHTPLKRACLPIPALPHLLSCCRIGVFCPLPDDDIYYSIQQYICQAFFQIFLRFFSTFFQRLEKRRTCEGV